MLLWTARQLRLYCSIFVRVVSIHFASHMKCISLYDTELYSLYIQEMVQSEKNYLDMIFVENVCVFGIILKRNNGSFYCFLNHIIYFCKSRVMLRLVRQGKIPFVPLFAFIEEIVMKVSTTKQLICEDNDERNYWSIF